jgi:hypothetical protein
MQTGGVTSKQVAIDAFVSVLEDARVAVALGFGSAISASREASRASAALYQAASGRDLLDGASTVAEHVAAEIEVDRWRQYFTVHSAIALEGSLVVFNSVDLALKHYARTRYGAADRRWVVGGPSYGPTPRTLFEIVRALCNYFRHRDEWLVGQGLQQASRSISILSDLGINPTAANAHLAVFAMLPFTTWLDFESAIVAAIGGVR